MAVCWKDTNWDRVQKTPHVDYVWGFCFCFPQSTKTVSFVLQYFSTSPSICYFSTFKFSCYFDRSIVLQHQVAPLVDRHSINLTGFSAFHCACDVSNTYQPYNVWLPQVRTHSLTASSLFPKTQRGCTMSSSADHRKQIFLQEKTAIHFLTTFSEFFHRFSTKFLLDCIAAAAAFDLVSSITAVPICWYKTPWRGLQGVLGKRHWNGHAFSSCSTVRTQTIRHLISQQV